MSLILGALVGAGTSASSSVTASDKVPTQDESAARRAAAATKLFDDVVEAESDFIPLERLFLALGMDKPWPRMYRMIARMDPDKNGEVTRDESVTGMHAIIGIQVNRNMGLDADQDGVLTMKEFALQYYDTDGPKDEKGYTQSQVEGFEESDRNGDGGVTLDELDALVTDYYLRLFRAWRISGLFKEGGIVKDFTIDRETFAAIWGVEPGTKIPADIDERWSKWSGGEETMPLRYMGGYLSQVEPESLDAIESRALAPVQQ